MKKPYVLSIPEQAPETPRVSDQIPKAAAPPPAPAVSLPDLDQSDAFVQKMMKDLSPNAKWTDWLKIDHIIRVITASVVNIAAGVSPRPHLGFLTPGKRFSVKIKGGKIFLDPRSYQRYDLVANVFASLNATGTVKVYLTLKPLFQQAYRDLGYPEGDFQATLIAAMDRLLHTPVVRGDIVLVQAEKGINFLMVDDYLEKLSPAQKNLLRMGPENTLMIQKKLREMALALGVPDNRLPRIKEYNPRER